MPNQLKTVEKVIEAATLFYGELKEDKHGRYRSWEYCYSKFMHARESENPDLDFLSLHLAFYLASWGMYRGSSFLLQKDYTVHIPVVKEILKPKYNSLAGMQCTDYRNKQLLKLVFELSRKIEDIYLPVRNEVFKDRGKKDNLSDVLITKILMGTLGCVPAYDRYFVSGVKAEKITTGNYNEKSILKLVDFYEEHLALFEKTRKQLKVDGILYPQMKLLDMGFWKIGFDIEDDSSIKPH